MAASLNGVQNREAAYMTKTQIKQRLLELLEASWGTVWTSAAKREELAEYLSTRFRPASGVWEVRADQEMAVEAGMRTIYVVHRGEHESYSSESQTEATAVAEVLSVLETEMRAKESRS